MDARSFDRSRAEVLFAELLVAEPNPSASRVRDLGATHPELAPELERLHAQLVSMRRILGELPRTTSESTRTSPLVAVPPKVDPPDLGAFRCLRLLGAGGMGEVWEAEDRALGRTVAVKLLRGTWSAGDVQIERFLREARAAGRVQHPAVVAVYQTGEWQGRPYIVQELVPKGRTLRDEIAELRRLPELPADHARHVARRFELLAGALCAAHAAGIVHRDVKPRNVLLTPDGEAKLADFGLALLVDEASLSRTGDFLGTYYYASPEQIDGSKAVDERCDVFSLGATLYENLTLERPFEGDSAKDVARAVLRLDPPAPQVVCARVPRDLSLVCMKALEKRPEDRYRSMAELRDELRRFRAFEPIRARAPSAPRRALKWSQRHPTAAATLCLSLAASAALAALFVRSVKAREDAVRANAQTSELNRALVASAEDLRVETTVAEEVIAFLLGTFGQAHPLLSGDRVPTVREVLESAVQRLEGGEVADPRARARLLGQLGEVLQGLGDDAQARRLLEESLALWEGLGRGQGPEASEVECALAHVLSSLRELPAAEAHLAALVERVERDAELAERLGMRILLTLGHVLSEQGRLEEAKRAIERAEALEEQYGLGPARPYLHLSLQLCKAKNAHMRGRSDEARGLLQAIVAENEGLLARADVRVLDAIHYLGKILVAEGRFEEAEGLFLDLCEDAGRSLDVDHPFVLSFRRSLASVWEATGRFVEAEALNRELLPLFEARSGPLDNEVLVLRNSLAICLVRQGRVAEAEELLRDVWEKTREARGEAHPHTLIQQQNLAEALFQLGRSDEAASLQERLVALTAPGDPAAARRQAGLETYRAAAQAASAASQVLQAAPTAPVDAAGEGGALDAQFAREIPR